MASLMNIINHLRKKLADSIQTLSENTGGAFPNLFYDVRIILTLKLDKDILRKLQEYTVKILNMILVSKTLQYR